MGASASFDFEVTPDEGLMIGTCVYFTTPKSLEYRTSLPSASPHKASMATYNGQHARKSC